MALDELKLYMILLGSKAPARHVEQHDFFFGITRSLKDLVPDIKNFWPEAGEKIHIDGWREVTSVDGFNVTIVPRDEQIVSTTKLFFVNLGGYLPDRFEEQHHVTLTAKTDRAAAMNEAKATLFYKTNGFQGANSHIDDKYGVDVDELYEIDEVLVPSHKAKYKIVLTNETVATPDKVNLGYLKLASLE